MVKMMIRVREAEKLSWQEMERFLLAATKLRFEVNRLDSPCAQAGDDLLAFLLFRGIGGMIGPDGGGLSERRSDRKGLIWGVTKSMMTWTGSSGVRFAANCTSSARLALQKQHSQSRNTP
jgi:hypothetical protein